MKGFKEYLDESNLKVGDKVKEIAYPLEIGIITKVEKKTLSGGEKYTMYMVDNGDGVVSRDEFEIKLATQKDFDKLAALHASPKKINKKKKSFFDKLKSMFEEVSTATIGAGVLAPIKADGKAFGMDYFEVCDDKFENCKRSVKKKFKHWNKLLGSKDIQQYAKENKGAFLIKRSGYEQYLRAR